LKLAEGRLGTAERRQIVRHLVAQAARNQVTAGLDPYKGEPVPEGSYDLPLKRAFERACRLHDRLYGEDPDEGFEALAPIVAGYSTSEPSARRA
jgi:hypothetical protein